VACLLTAAECFRKHVVSALPVAEAGKGWYRMRCPVGTHGQPLRFHTGDYVHISWTDLGHCPESEIYAWLLKQGVPRGCLKRPKDWQPPAPAKDFGTEDGKLADAILNEALGDGTPTERMIRMVVAALGEVPEGPMVDILADRLRLTPRMIWKATADLRKH
jgi:hypothetical protein